MVQEGRGETEPAPVLVHHLGRGARAGEEPGVEVGELGDQRAADDQAGRPALDGPPGGVQGIVLHVDQEQDARGLGALGAPAARRPRARRGPRRPRARQMPREVTATTTASTARRATRDDDGDQEPGEPRGVIGMLQGALLAGERNTWPSPSTTNSSRSRRAMAANTSGGAHR